MNFEYYKIFYYVAKHKNLTRAAEELFSSQPAVSRTLQNMESELGCRLFTRNKSGVEFTHEGKRLYEYVSVAFQQLIKAEEELSQSVSVDGGTIYIGTTVTALYGFLFDFLDGFHLKYPHVKFQMRTDSSDATIDHLKKGVVDLAFITTPFTLSKPLIGKPLKTFQDVLIAGNRFSELKGKTLALEDLERYPFITTSKGTQFREFVDGIFSEHGLPLKPEVETDAADQLAPMATHNFGLAFAPQSMAQTALERGEIFRIPLKTEAPKRQIYMITDPHHPQTNASRELYKRILESIRST